ncbi:MAG: hypothetical protein HWD62_10310 [Cyclobacteriaceae bacterium]|nr:MAG: hypothetical protein HWD62_10310 [Cyclobacteriaceae bacterium]
MPELTDTTEKGLEAHITQHLCLVNAFEERHFSNYNRVDCVDEDLLLLFCKPHRKRKS